ncbi:MAG: hypothetical protein FJZ90_00070 [Chloroflexi bacterium]|nr:hypothetical protein [Chloroflexota bacterium]
MASSAELALIMSLVDEVTSTAEKVKGSLKDVGTEAQGLQGTLNGAFQGLAKIGGTAIIGGVGAAAAAVTGLGAAALAAGMDFDAAFDTIVQKTGATGAELEQMKADATAVFKSLPVDIGATADVIATLNQRLGVTGESAQGLASQLLMLGTGDAVASAELYTRVMGDWGIATEDASTTLDTLFTASQLTGIGVDDLAGKLVQFGAPLRLMGFDLEQSAALFAKWEQEGVNAELVMGSLRIAAGNFAKENIPLQEGLQQTIAQIQGMDDASAALALGMEVFGARAGPDMTAAIREGRFSIEELTAAMQDSEGAILNTAQATMDFPEKLQVMKNMAQTALAPIGLSIMDIVGKLLESLMPAFERLTGWLEGTLAPAVDAAMPHIETLITAFGALLSGDTEAFWAGITEGLLGLGEAFGVSREQLQPFLEGLQSTATAIATFVSEHSEALKTALIAIGAVLAAAAIAGAIVGIGAAIAALANPVTAIILAVGLLATAWAENWGGIQEKTQAVIDFIMGIIGPAVEFIQGLWAEHGEAIKTTASGAWEAIKTGSSAAWEFLKTNTSAGWEAVKGAYATSSEFIKTQVNTALEAIRAFWAEHGETIKGIIQGFLDVIRGVFDTQLNAIRGVFEAFKLLLQGDWEGAGKKLVETASQFLTDIANVFTTLKSTVVNAAKAIFSDAVDAVKKAITDKIEEIKQAGKDLIAGFIEGIKSAPGAIADAAKGAASGAVNAVKGFLGVGSPSKVMIDIGKDTMTGLAMGIDQGQAKVLEKIGEFLSGLSDMFGVLTGQDMGGLDAGSLRARVDALAEVLVYAIKRFADIQRLYGYKEIKELDKTTTRFGRMLEVIAKDLSKIKGLEDPTAIPRFFNELEQMIHHALALARRIGGKYGKDLLEEMGKISELILKVLSLTGFDPESVKMAEKGLPDLVKWGEQLYAIIIRATEILAAVRKAVSDSLLAEYAGVTENVTKILSLTQGANIENMLAIAGEKFPDLELWGQRLYAMIVRGVEVLQAIRAYIADDLLKEIVGISEHLSKIAQLFSVGGIEQIRTLTKEEFPDLTAWANKLYRMFAMGIEVFKAVRAYIEDEALAAATGISEHLSKVAQIFSVGGLAAMRELADAEMPDLFQWGQNLFNMIEWGIAVFKSVRQQIEDKALAEATGISESLGKVTQLFSVGGLAAMRELVTLEFPNLDAWAGRLFHMIVAGINVLLALRAQINDKMLKIVAGVAEDIQVIAQLFEMGGLAAMEKLTTAKWPDLGVWGQRLYAMITAAIDVLKSVRDAIGAKLLAELAGIAEALGKAWAIVELRTDIGVTPAKFFERLISHLDAIVDAVPLVRDALQRVRAAGTTLETLAADAELSEKLKSFFSILDLNKVFQEVQVIRSLSAGERRTALSNVLTNLGIMLEAAAPILRAALEKFREQWGSLEALAEDVDLSESVQKLFSILDVSKVMEEMRIAKPLAKGEKRLPFVEVLTNFIGQMKEAAPIIRDGLQEINEIFEEQAENMSAIADRVRDVFVSLASAVQAASEMTVSRWNLNNVLRMIREIAIASRAVSEIPVPEFGAPVTPVGSEAGMDGDRRGIDPDAIKAAIIEGIQGSAIAFDLSLVQDPSQRAEFSFRLGRLERMFAEFVTKWEAAGA